MCGLSVLTGCAAFQIAAALAAASALRRASSASRSRRIASTFAWCAASSVGVRVRPMSARQDSESPVRQSRNYRRGYRRRENVPARIIVAFTIAGKAAQFAVWLRSRPAVPAQRIGSRRGIAQPQSLSAPPTSSRIGRPFATSRM